MEGRAPSRPQYPQGRRQPVDSSQEALDSGTSMASFRTLPVLFGEVAELVEGARLLSECGGYTSPRVRIPPSPPVFFLRCATNSRLPTSSFAVTSPFLSTGPLTRRGRALNSAQFSVSLTNVSPIEGAWVVDHAKHAIPMILVLLHDSNMESI